MIRTTMIYGRNEMKIIEMRYDDSTYEKRWGKYRHTPALAIPATAAEGRIHILEASTDESQVLAAEFTDKKLRILFLKECKAETRAQFDTPFTLEEIFDVRVKACMPNQFTLCAVIAHHNHNPWILDWMPIIGWSFAKLDIGSKQPQTIEEKADD